MHYSKIADYDVKRALADYESDKKFEEEEEKRNKTEKSSTKQKKFEMSANFKYHPLQEKKFL